MLSILSLLALLLSDVSPAASSEAPALASRHASWLEESVLLLSENEKATFLALQRDFQRDEFIRRFWRSRDPFPDTARNEFEETWRERVLVAKEKYGTLSEDRAQALLALGRPETELRTTCIDLLRPIEIWYVTRTAGERGAFALAFFSPNGAPGGPYKLWYPSQGLMPLVSLGASFGQTEEILQRIAETCSRGDDIAAGLSAAIDLSADRGLARFVPRPKEEWLRTFTSFSTDLPVGAQTFDAELSVVFPGRHQSRTVVQGVLSVAADAVELSNTTPAQFVLDGEVLRGEELFEHFRYRFHVGQNQALDGRLPILFQRLLRPGEYTLLLKVEELSSGRFYRRELPLSVPEASSAARTAATPSPSSPTKLDEANRALAGGDVAVKIMEPSPKLYVGRHRFEAVALGGSVGRMRFELNGKVVLTKREAPYSAEVDLGSVPRLHRLRAVALDAEGGELASDEVVLNAGPHRFAVRLVEPRSGATYKNSVPARAVVEVPEGEMLEKVELYLNDNLAATLFQPPFSQPLLVHQHQEGPSFVRVVATLAGGATSEDAVLINSPDFSESVEVRFVELFTSVVDRRGRPVEDLPLSEFTVREEGVEQEVRRFELVRDVPLNAGILLDTSSSMQEELPDAIASARAFFTSVLTPKDRACVITFSDSPQLAVRFTADSQLLDSGLQGIRAEGETALYDSLIYAFYYFSGTPGKRALILLSDGEDAGSKYGFEDVVQYARRTGVAVYAIGIGLSGRQTEFRLKLARLARETGGQSFFIEGAGGITRAYEAIEAELRSQYLLAYQPSNPAADGRYRQVEVLMKNPAHKAKTIEGYYP